MKKTFCDMCKDPVGTNIVKDVKCGSKFAGHHVTVSVKISTDGDFCADCLVNSILRGAIVTSDEDKQETPSE